MQIAQNTFKDDEYARKNSKSSSWHFSFSKCYTGGIGKYKLAFFSRFCRDKPIAIINKQVVLIE